MNDDQYKMKIEDEEIKEEKEDKISKFKLINIIIVCAMCLNYLFIILLGSGIFDRSSSTIFETYFKLSFTLVPLICMLALIINRNKHSSDKQYEKNDFLIYLPYIQSFMIILLFGAKFTIQLNREILFELISITFTFLLLQFILVLIMREKEISKKKYYILNACTYLSMVLFIIILILLSYDYSVLL